MDTETTTTASAARRGSALPLQGARIEARRATDATTAREFLIRREAGGAPQRPEQAFAEATLWPLMHGQLANVSPQRETAYYAGGARVAQELAGKLGNGDRVWVHGNEVLPVGQALRSLGKAPCMGFVLETPFPPKEILAALPGWRRLARAVFAYDVVVVASHRDEANIADLAVEAFGADVLKDGRLKVGGRLVSVVVAGMGIDPSLFPARAIPAPAVIPGLDGQKLVVGMDRLDAASGLPEKLDAYERLLAMRDGEAAPVLLQIVQPAARAVTHRALRARIDGLTAHVNGRFATLEMEPLRVIWRRLAREHRGAIYQQAHVGLFTPLGDAMGLGAKEFIAAQDQTDPGVLVLSSLSGAAEELDQALLVNPYDGDGVAEAVKRALEMPLAERQWRHQSLLGAVKRRDIFWWQARLSHALDKAAAPMGRAARGIAKPTRGAGLQVGSA